MGLMKYASWVLTTIAALAMVCAGCGKKSEVNAGPIKKNFRSAEPATKSVADKAAASIEAGDYQTAMADLNQLSIQPGLTEEQKEAIKEVLIQVQDKLA